jgi:hypothetical protein
MFDNFYRSITSIQRFRFASAFGRFKDSILCHRFLMFSTISGNLLLARIKPRPRNYIGFLYSSGTVDPKLEILFAHRSDDSKAEDRTEFLSRKICLFPVRDGCWLTSSRTWRI